MSHVGHRFAIIVAVFALSACGQQTTDVTRTGPATGTVAQVNTPTVPAPSAGGAASSVLRFAQGTWASDCRALPFRAPFRARLIFSGMTVTHESSVYQDAQCRQLLSTWSRQLLVTQVHREESEDDDNVEIDLSVRATGVNLTTFNGYAALAGPVCGVQGWIDGSARDVSGKDCGPGRLETSGRESTLTFIYDPDFSRLSYQGDLLRLQ